MDLLKPLHAATATTHSNTTTGRQSISRRTRAGRGRRTMMMEGRGRVERAVAWLALHRRLVRPHRPPPRRQGMAGASQTACRGCQRCAEVARRRESARSCVPFDARVRARGRKKNALALSSFSRSTRASSIHHGHRRRPHLRRAGRQPHRPARVGAESGKSTREERERRRRPEVTKGSPEQTPFARARTGQAHAGREKKARRTRRRVLLGKPKGVAGAGRGATHAAETTRPRLLVSRPALLSLHPFHRNAQLSSATWTPPPRTPSSGSCSPRPGPSRRSTYQRTASRASTRGMALSSFGRPRTRTTRRGS